MTRERIENFREIVLPFVKKRLLEINYENLGESDAEMFAKDFDEILNLAINALDQEPTTKIDYRRAFKIACDLLNGDSLYGVDTDKIFELMMQKDGVVSSSSYREYILGHLQELDQGQYASESVTSTDSTTKNDLALIHTEGLDEEIRCTMCTNSMKSDRGCDGSCVVNKNMYKAVMDAIEKRIQPTTKNDLEVDAISRRSVIKEMEKRYAEGDYITKGFINSLPSVTPIRPKGHWISHKEHCENLGVMPSGLGAYEWCSNCDCGIDVREWHRNNYNFCPNCGAKMIEPQESEQ